METLYTTKQAEPAWRRGSETPLQRSCPAAAGALEGQVDAIESRLPRLLLTILTSPGYLFEANTCGKKKEFNTLSNY